MLYEFEDTFLLSFLKLYYFLNFSYEQESFLCSSRLFLSEITSNFLLLEILFISFWEFNFSMSLFFYLSPLFFCSSLLRGHVPGLMIYYLYVGLNAVTVFQPKAFVALAGTVGRMLCEREKVWYLYEVRWSPRGRSLPSPLHYHGYGKGRTVTERFRNYYRRIGPCDFAYEFRSVRTCLC